MEKTSFLTNNATPSAAVTTGFESTEDRLQQSLLSADRAATPSRRRPRASRACEMCRGRKSKCDQQSPCSHCATYSLKCTYRDLPNGRAARRERGLGTIGSALKCTTNQQKPCLIRPIQSKSQDPISARDVDLTNDATGQLARSGQAGIGSLTPSERDTQHEMARAWSIDGSVEVPIGEEYPSATGTPGLDGVNTHTSGTEFYGGSSNLAFLASLFVKARKRATTSILVAPAESSGNTGSDMGQLQGVNVEPQHLNDTALSIVDLMYSTDYNSPSEERRSTTATTAAAAKPVSSPTRPFLYQERCTPGVVDDLNVTSSSPNASTAVAVPEPTDDISRGVERIFIDAYFSGKHYIHPILTESAFLARCKTIVWNNPLRSPSRGRQSQFLALYYAVVATAAINSGASEDSALEKYYSEAGLNNRTKSPKKRSILDWSSIYFGLAKKSLGDYLEKSSLEICQALFLMTGFCQNALKPHECYMYSGMAVRTAIAIGLANDPGMKRTEEERRTWWSIYSHEVEMCCSSGRFDSLMPSHRYSVALPTWTTSPELLENGNGGLQNAIIHVMVDLSRTLKAASLDLYCDGNNISLKEKSQKALQLTGALDLWKSNLPPFLNLDVNSLSDAEWAFKQKVVLKMRFYNARIVVNRPFILASSTSQSPSEFSQHVDICLDAARQTIHLIHDAFVNRIYLRTWWYCTTYTLYASMIILYLILMDFPRVTGTELIADVEKSLEIFTAMKQIVVARRCAELTREIVAVAKRHLQNSRKSCSGLNGHKMTEEALLQGIPFPTPSERSVRTGSEAWNDHFLSTFLSQEIPESEKASALANLYDPNVMDDFALSASSIDQITGSMDMTMNLSTRLCDEREQVGPMWGPLESYGISEMTREEINLFE